MTTEAELLARIGELEAAMRKAAPVLAELAEPIEGEIGMFYDNSRGAELSRQELKILDAHRAVKAALALAGEGEQK